jgi:succinoglycan biosynthesis transport protein ExoP
MTNQSDLALSSMPDPNVPSTHVPLAARAVSLRDLWQIISRRQKLILSILACSIALGVLYALFMPRLYRANAQMEILKQDAAAGLSDPAQASATMAADALDFNLAVQTQVNVLHSRRLMLRVIEEIKLDRTSEYQLSGDKAEVGLPLEQAPRRAAFVLERFEKRLDVKPVSGTRLISVSFLDPDPKRAAQVVNQLLADFVDYNFQVRFAASTQATSFLAKELGDMKHQVDSSEATAVQLQQQSGIYGVDATNNATNSKLEQLNADLTTAQANLALKESVYKLALTRSPEVLAGMIGAQGTGANTANGPLQLLRQEQADQAANYADLNARYGPQYPKVLQAGERLKSIQTSIRSEVTRLVGQATAEYRVAQDTERAAAIALQQQKGVASKMNHDAILYTSAKHEADTNRDLYEQLMSRLKQAGVLAGLHSSNISILDPAIPPSRPAQPMILLGLLLSALAGLIIGVVVALLVDSLDDTVRDPQTIEELTGTRVLALLPPAERSLPKAAVQSLQRSSHHGSWQYQTTARAPRSTLAESFRVLRTALISLGRTRRLGVIAITSTSESEGKSFTTFNLAAAFAQSGRSVVVVDADLRKSALTRALGMEHAEGLDEAIVDVDWKEYVKTYEEIPGLFIMPAGRREHHPADVLGSDAMAQLLKQLKETFDIVLIDTPSILSVSDTVSLSAIVDGVVVVAKCGETEQHSLTRTLSVLRRAGARVLGIVLNGIDFDSSDFYYYWGKQGDGYKSSAEQILSPAPRIIQAATSTIPMILLFLGSFAFLHPGAAKAQAADSAAVGSVSQDSTTRATPQTSMRTALLMPGAPVDLPQTTIIGVGDLLHIDVFDAPDLTEDVRVGGNGNVHLSLLGDVHAAGLAPDVLARNLEVSLSEKGLMRTPNVSIELKEFNTQGVTVEGEVVKPGIYPIYSARSLVDILAISGGRTTSADTQILVRRRGSNIPQRIDLRQTDGTAEAESNVRVFPGDTVIVPRAGLAYVLGSVQRPGGYIMRNDGRMTVLEAISEAQGTTGVASLNHVLLLRKTEDGTVTIPIQLKAMQRGKEPDQRLVNGDILFVPSSGLKDFAKDTQAITASLSGAALYAVAH